MRCKKHASDLSSRVGVCATCLRERLSAVIAAQAQAQARKSEQLPPLSFPRSVSPYISRRKSDPAAAPPPRVRHQRFHSTPEVGPTGSITVEIKKGKLSSLFSSLFRSKSISNPSPICDPRVPVDPCSASPSWFAGITRRKKIGVCSADDSTAGARRRTCRSDRGMSPARDEEENCHGGLSGYSSESSQGWRQTPRRTPAATRRCGGKAAVHSINISGLAFCLSPLVRASPNRHWSQKGFPPEMVAAGEARVTAAKPHLSNAPSFCKNRSRKLADFGRCSYDPPTY